MLKKNNKITHRKRLLFIIYSLHCKCIIVKILHVIQVNFRAKKREEFKQQLKELKERPKANQQPESEDEEELFELTQAPPPKTNKYFDPRVQIEGPTRQKKQMKFNEKGKFINIAQKIRTKVLLFITVVSG